MTSAKSIEISWPFIIKVLLKKTNVINYNNYQPTFLKINQTISMYIESFDQEAIKRTMNLTVNFYY